MIKNVVSYGVLHQTTNINCWVLEGGVDKNLHQQPQKKNSFLWLLVQIFFNAPRLCRVSLRSFLPASIELFNSLPASVSSSSSRSSFLFALDRHFSKDIFSFGLT